MEIFPAIDILGGKVVRLARGDYDAVTFYNDDPVQQARFFEQQGATWVHLVDLDGARSGTPVNHEIVRRIIEATNLKVEVGGGVRSLETIENLVESGASRIVIGTKLITDPEFTQEAISIFGDIICAGVDANKGSVAIEGWRKGTSTSSKEIISQLRVWEVKHLVYTDINRDGMQTGIDAENYRQIAHLAGFPVTASGGIHNLDDLRDLKGLGDGIIEAAIIGRALYEGNFSLAEAIGLFAFG